MYYIVNIGSNLGDRRLNLSKAMAAIMRLYGDIEMSHTIETEPAGFDSPHRFLNVCIMFRSDNTPLEVLDRMQEIEQSISPAPHRNDDGTYRDRIIDIDILAADDLTMEHERLTIPHPRLAERSFYLEPMAEIASGWRHPVTGLTVADMLAALN